jgi:hypothetical protein
VRAVSALTRSGDKKVFQSKNPQRGGWRIDADAVIFKHEKDVMGLAGKFFET